METKELEQCFKGLKNVINYRRVSSENGDIVYKLETTYQTPYLMNVFVYYRQKDGSQDYQLDDDHLMAMELGPEWESDDPLIIKGSGIDSLPESVTTIIKKIDYYYDTITEDPFEYDYEPYMFKGHLIGAENPLFRDFLEGKISHEELDELLEEVFPYDYEEDLERSNAMLRELLGDDFEEDDCEEE